MKTKLKSPPILGSIDPAVKMHPRGPLSPAFITTFGENGEEKYGFGTWRILYLVVEKDREDRKSLFPVAVWWLSGDHNECFLTTENGVLPSAKLCIPVR
jgi:hypothetical protein